MNENERGSPSPHRLRQRTRRAWLAAAIAVAAQSGCGAPAALTRLMEARRLASELRVEFTKAAEAANRAVMADTDEVSAAAAGDARRARQVVERDTAALQTTLQSLGFGEDLGHLEAFKARLEEYRRLDDEILPLAVENTNLKAQRLSFGAAREAAETLRTSLDAAVRAVAPKDSPQARELAAAARIGVLEILALQAPHIAEPSDDVMTRLEAEMKMAEADARKAVAGFKGLVGTAGASQLAAATAALDRFMSTNGEIVVLSRRNTNVRSLALSLGRKRTVTAECEDHLRALEQALAKHAFTATR